MNHEKQMQSMRIQVRWLLALVTILGATLLWTAWKLGNSAAYWHEQFLGAPLP